MIEEVDSAVGFLSRIISHTKMQGGQLDTFKEMLQVIMVNHYQNHWFPEKPCKGSGYRCLRIVNQKMDPLITKAGALIGMSESDLLNVLPRELTMWVDPSEVSYRIGEEGSIGVLFDREADSSSSDDSDTCDSNRSTPNLSSSQSQGIFQQQQQHPQSCSQEQLMSNPTTTGASQVSQDTGLSNNWEFISTFVAS